MTVNVPSFLSRLLLRNTSNQSNTDKSNTNTHTISSANTNITMIDKPKEDAALRRRRSQRLRNGNKAPDNATSIIKDNDKQMNGDLIEKKKEKQTDKGMTWKVSACNVTFILLHILLYLMNSTSHSH